MTPHQRILRMAKKDPPSPTAPTDLAPVPASSLVRAASTEDAALLAELQAAGIDVASDDTEDGLAEVLATDLRTPKKLWNLTKADGLARISKDQFLDSVDRTSADVLNVILLDIHKTNLFEVYNGERNITQCSSYDREFGVWAGEGNPQHEVGEHRRCKGCPDQAWRDVLDTKTGKRKREQPCAEVWNVAAFDLDAMRVCLMAFKKTSLNSIRTYAQTHHIGKLPVPGKRAVNIPLCVYRVRITLEMDKKTGNFAVPVLTRGERLSAGDIKVMHETTIGVRETFQARLHAAEESARGDVAGDDTSFDVDAMGGDAAVTRGSEAFVG
jgi:hypothetical protein